MGRREGPLQAPVGSRMGYYVNPLRMVCVEVQSPAGFEVQPASIGADHHSGRVAHHYEGKSTVGGIPEKAAGSDAKRYILAGTPYGYTQWR